MPYREHPLMKDSQDNDASLFGTIKDHVALKFDSAKGGIDFDVSPAGERALGEQFEMGLEFVHVAGRLVFTPAVEGIPNDFRHIGFGAASETKPGHALPASARELEFFSQAGKRVALRDSTLFAFGDRVPKRVQLRFVFSLLPLQVAEGGPDDLAGVLVAAGFDFGSNEAVEFFGQINIARGHRHHVSKDC
jgi:hypothetical protein